MATGGGGGRGGRAPRATPGAGAGRSSAPHAAARPPPGRPFVATPVTYRGPAPTAASLRAAVRGTNVIICVLDAARADHFSSYGYPRETTPNCDRLAQQGLAFEQHFCEAPITRPSTASLFTGLHPDSHGLLLNVSAEPLSPRLPTMEGAFAGAGYATYLLSSHAVASPEFGLGADFQYWRAPKVKGTEGDFDRVAWLRAEFRALLPRWQARNARVFAYLHVLPPHYPYRAPSQFGRSSRAGRPVLAKPTAPRHGVRCRGAAGAGLVAGVGEPIRRQPAVGRLLRRRPGADAGGGRPAGAHAADRYGRPRRRAAGTRVLLSPGLAL